MSNEELNLCLAKSRKTEDQQIREVLVEKRFFSLFCRYSGKSTTFAEIYVLKAERHRKNDHYADTFSKRKDNV